MTKKKVKRKKRRHYHTGEYTSTKTGLTHKYRSGWEEKYMKWLDSSDLVEGWEYESVIVPYVSNVKTGKMRKYFPDFLVHYEDGHIEMVEIKPSKRVHQVKVAKKLLAAGDHCRAHGLTFTIITEVELKGLGLL